GFLPLTKGRSRIIDEHMQLPVALLEGCCKLPDGLLRGQIREQEVYGIIAALSLDIELCLFASGAITTNHDHGCPHASQSQCSGFADPGISPGDQTPLPLHLCLLVCHVVYLLSLVFLSRITERF